jgi:CHASE3 domain sensor protein
MFIETVVLSVIISALLLIVISFFLEFLYDRMNQSYQSRYTDYPDIRNVRSLEKPVEKAPVQLLVEDEAYVDDSDVFGLEDLPDFENL